MSCFHFHFQALFLFRSKFFPFPLCFHFASKVDQIGIQILEFGSVSFSTLLPLCLQSGPNWNHFQKFTFGTTGSKFLNLELETESNCKQECGTSRFLDPKLKPCGPMSHDFFSCFNCKNLVFCCV